ncbi:MAG: hypothetical protein ACREPE_00210, partial [Lysobacter sp.]
MVQLPEKSVTVQRAARKGSLWIKRSCDDRGLMNRIQANTVAIVVGLAAIALPVLLAFHVAHQLSLDTVSAQALALSQ